MGYPIFGKVKTIVLPIPAEEMSLDEYQEKYGINLRELLKIHSETGSISLETNALVLIQDINGVLHTQGSLGDGYSWEGSIFPVSGVKETYYSEGEARASLEIGGINAIESTTFGIGFMVRSDDELTIENVRVYAKIN